MPVLGMNGGCKCVCRWCGGQVRVYPCDKYVYMCMPVELPYNHQPPCVYHVFTMCSPSPLTMCTVHRAGTLGVEAMGARKHQAVGTAMEAIFGEVCSFTSLHQIIRANSIHKLIMFYPSSYLVFYRRRLRTRNAWMRACWKW